MGEEVEELVKRLTIRARDCESMALDFRDIGGRNADTKADEYTAAFRDFRAAIDAIESLRASLTRVEEERDEAVKALEPFAERSRAEFTTGDYHNPEPAPDTQIFGSELLLSLGDLRRAGDVHKRLSRAISAEGK